MSGDLSVLVVDTDERLLLERADHLLVEGHEVSVAGAERTARLKLAQALPDVVVLSSVGSPAATLALLRHLRDGAIHRADPGVRVTTVGADTDAQATTHYTAGADLALPSRASLQLLAAAVAMLGARAHAGDEPARVLRVGSLLVDADARTTSVGEQSVSLSRLEFDLLRCLASSPNRTFTRAELAREVWGSEVMGHRSRTVDSHVGRVRRKLYEAGAGDQIQTVRGVGFRLSR